MNKINRENTTEEITTQNTNVSGAKIITAKKVIKSICCILVILCLLFLIVVVVQLCVDRFKNKSPVPSAFGYATLTIQTGSMSGTIEIGDMIIIKSAEEYKIGDIVTFLPQNDTIPTTHRIVGKDGDKFFTKGDNNNADDGEYITKSNIYGKVVKVIPKVGLFVTWFTQEFGWLFFVGIIFIIVIGVYILKNFIIKEQKVPVNVINSPEQKDQNEIEAIKAQKNSKLTKNQTSQKDQKTPKEQRKQISKKKDQIEQNNLKDQKKLKNFKEQ